MRDRTTGWRKMPVMIEVSAPLSKFSSALVQREEGVPRARKFSEKEGVARARKKHNWTELKTLAPGAAALASATPRAVDPRYLRDPKERFSARTADFV